MQNRAVQLVGWAGIAVHLVVGLAYAFTGLLAPSWAVGLLWALWGALLAMALLVRRSRPWLAAVTPLIAMAAWLAALALGERLLGWTA
ncbi:hypothetical protein SOCEGT47_005810 [Sorangium cellulosum]|uniref:Uncharacterized protein n=1 Tax=Sorangium cellulosum TaxID=56 RepID=A0A4P2PU51_SORCE|nr:hypothetical protein SOCEGT47_005810 [Sorangium cellulosum]